MSSVKSKGQTESRLIEGLQEFFPNQIFTPSNLKNPTREFVVGFYLEFLANIGVNTEALCQVSPSLYEKFGSTYVMRKLYLALREVFNKILLDEIQPFGLMDLLQPTQGRTAAFFTGMINFMCYSLHKLRSIDEFIDELEMEKEKFDNLLKERETLRQKLNEEAETRARIVDLEAEVVKKQQELKNVAEEVDAADKVIVEKEKAIKDLETKLELVNKDLSLAQHEMANTEALVVRSPLSVKNQKCQLEQKLCEADEKTNTAKEMLTSKREISKKLETLGEELDSRISLLKKIIVESKEISKGKELTEDVRKKISKAKEDQDEVNAERQKLHEREVQLQETESGMILRCETKKKEFVGRIKAMRRELDDILKQTSEEKLSLQNAVDKCCGEISRLVNVYTVLCKKYEDMYAALLLKEKSVGDEAVEELEEVIAKFQKYG